MFFAYAIMYVIADLVRPIGFVSQMYQQILQNKKKKNVKRNMNHAFNVSLHCLFEEFGPSIADMLIICLIMGTMRRPWNIF